jgi:hypothetical protein
MEEDVLYEEMEGECIVFQHVAAASSMQEHKHQSYVWVPSLLLLTQGG